MQGDTAWCNVKKYTLLTQRFRFPSCPSYRPSVPGVGYHGHILCLEHLYGAQQSPEAAPPVQNARYRQPPHIMGPLEHSQYREQGSSVVKVWHRDSR